MEEQVKIYELIINVAGPGFTDRVVITGELHELEPVVIDENGFEYVRYGDHDSYTEIRRDYIVSRRLLEVIQKQPEPATEDRHRPQLQRTTLPRREER